MHLFTKVTFTKNSTLLTGVEEIESQIVHLWGFCNKTRQRPLIGDLWSFKSYLNGNGECYLHLERRAGEFLSMSYVCYTEAQTPLSGHA